MAAVQNTLLAALPRKDYLKRQPELSPVALDFGDVLYEPDRPAYPRRSRSWKPS